MEVPFTIAPGPGIRSYMNLQHTPATSPTFPNKAPNTKKFSDYP